MCLWSFTEMNLNSQNWCKPKKPPFAVAFLLAASYLLILFCTSDILHLEQPKWEWIFCIYDLHQPESFPWSHIFCFPDTAAPQQIEKHQIWYTNVYLELTEINLNPRNDANQYFFIKLFFFKRNTICFAMHGYFSLGYLPKATTGLPCQPWEQHRRYKARETGFRHPKSAHRFRQAARYRSKPHRHVTRKIRNPGTRLQQKCIQWGNWLK